MTSIMEWSKEDLETLMKISNVRRALGNPDNAYFVRGNKPPPVMNEEGDDEMRQLFGDTMHAGDAFPDNSPPDLEGITTSIRRYEVDTSKEDDFSSFSQPFENIEETIGQRSDYLIEISKGSNLNPNSKEFIPKSTSTSDISVHTRDGEITDPIATDETKVTEKAAEDLETKLKNQISDASKSKSFESKKQRNVAIATLLNRYAMNTETPPVRKPAETLKLITPDYFENLNNQVNIQSGPNDTTLPSTLTSPPSAPTSPGPKSMTSISHASSSNDVKSEPALSTRASTKKQKPEQDPAIKTSINKVNEWFGEQTVNQTAPRKSPAVFLGPIKYKSKEPSACQSPKIPDTEQQRVTEASEPKQYKPTNYAADLKNKYMEHANNKKVESEDKILFHNLYKVLKKKDDIIAKRKLEQSSENSSDSDAPRRN